MIINDIPISKIKNNPYQTRKIIDDESLKILIKSIRENGLINPINVIKQDGEYVILSGHRRFECYKKMRRETIPCIIRKRKIDGGNLKVNMAHENLLRDDLQPIEKAQTIRLLIDDKISTARNDPLRMIQIINKLKIWKRRGDSSFEKLEGFDENDIFRMQNVLKSLNLSENNAVVYLSVLGLPRNIQEAISWKKGQIYDEGKIKISHAEQLVRVKDKKYQDYLFRKCLNYPMARERLRALVDNHIREYNVGEFKGIYKSAQIGRLKSHLDNLRVLQDTLVSTSKKINTFKQTSLLKLDETLEKEEFVSEVGFIKKELLKLLHQINEKLENRGIHKIEKESTLFDIEVLNQPRKRNGKVIMGGKRFSFPRSISNELNLKDKSLVTVKVVSVKNVESRK